MKHRICNESCWKVICVYFTRIRATCRKSTAKIYFSRVGYVSIIVNLKIENIEWVYVKIENASQPYSATVIINGMEYGKGYGSSKKQAKLEAGMQLNIEYFV